MERPGAISRQVARHGLARTPRGTTLHRPGHRHGGDGHQEKKYRLNASQEMWHSFPHSSWSILYWRSDYPLTRRQYSSFFILING